MKPSIQQKFVSFILVIVSSQFLLFGISNTAIAYSNISEKEILRLVNEQRQNNGLSPLSINSQLQSAAENKAQYLLDNNLFGHDVDQRTFSSWIKDANYKYSLIGENLATNFYSNKDLINAWLSSDSHRANILEKYFIETGISIKEKNGKIIIVQIFGRPNINPIELEKTIGNHLSECLIKYFSKPIKQKTFIEVV